MSALWTGPQTGCQILIPTVDSYPHIGYDINGKKIMRPASGDALQALLDSIELPKGWTGLTDINTGNPLNLRYDGPLDDARASWQFC